MVRPRELLRWAARTVWVAANNLYAIPASMIWLLLLSPIHLISPPLYNKVEEIFFSWLLSMVACWTWSAGYQVAESGDDLDKIKHENLLIMPNHQSTADVPLLMTIFSARVGFCNKVMWIMDHVFKYTNFGVVSWMHDDFFINPGRAHRETSLLHLREHLYKVFLPKNRKYLVLFPEGGFLRKRKAVSQEFAKKKDLPMLEYCTLPRTGALDVIMSALGPQPVTREESGPESLAESQEHDQVSNIEPNDSEPSPAAEGQIHKIVDVTVAFPEGRPLDLQTIVTGWRTPCVTHVHYRVFDSRDIPHCSEQLFSWMVRLYQEKEEMLEKFYETGKFPHDHFDSAASPPKLIHLDPLRFLIIHAFFLFSNYIFYCIALSLSLF